MEGEIDPVALGSWEIWKPAVFEVELVGSSAVYLQEEKVPSTSTILNVCASFQGFLEV